MELSAGRTTLVILGLWNPHILHPAWFARVALAMPEDVAVQTSVNVPVGTPAPPFYEVGGITYIPTSSRLTLQVEHANDDSLKLLQEAAHRILVALSHTPISAMGSNFEVVEQDPPEQHVKVFTGTEDLANHLAFRFDPLFEQTTSSLRLETSVLNISRRREGASLTVTFNFHYEADSAEKCARILAVDGLLTGNLNCVRQVIRELYDEELQLP